MKKTVSESAYAKINLFLAVKGRREDGYHEIESVMQTVSLCDIVTLTLEDDGGGRISLTCSDERIPCDDGNIAVRCARLFFERFGIDHGKYSLDIHIEKMIPVSGGLAGGSADGAATLRILSRMFAVSDEAALLALGAKIGADIPFCLTGGGAICTGIGDILEPIDVHSPECSVLIASPGGGVSTPEAYRLIDEEGERIAPCTAQDVARALENGAVPQVLHNDFEAVIFPRIEDAARLKTLMYERGAMGAMMSGSGPTIFGLFETEEKCESVAAELREAGYLCSVCRFETLGDRDFRA